MVLIRDPEYYGLFSGNLQHVELHLQKDPSDATVQLEMYEADRLDIYGIYAMLPQLLERARQRHIEDYVMLPGLNTYFLSFNVLNKPFNDIRVRQAFVLAAERDRLANVVLGGFVSTASGGLVPPGMPGHSAGIALPFDPEGARKLLAEAGYPDGRDFPTIHCLAPTPVDSVREYLLTQWRDNLGVEVTWVSVEWGEYLERVNTEGRPEICWHGWVADYPDPYSFLSDCLLTLGIGEQQGERLYNFLEKARHSTAQKERMKLYNQADKLLVEEAAIMPLNYGKWYEFVKPWVSKCPTSAITILRWKDIILDPH
jgi:oligopeptide transport system substrate-binding protein